MNEEFFKKVGHTIQIAGVIYNDDKHGQSNLLMLPDENLYVDRLVGFMNDEQWKKFFWQTDNLETEVAGKFGKIIVKKAQRQIDGRISWNVYHRDNYCCRYCGATGIPLTVDHLVLWEDGGPSIEENLVTACRKCNRIRGNMKYVDWINSQKYKSRSENLSAETKAKNNEIVHDLHKIPRSFHKMRGKKR